RDLVAALDVLVALECARHFPTDGAHYFVDIMAELVPAIGGETERARTRRILEVEDVAPVPWRRPLLRDVLELCSDFRRSSGAGWAGHEDIKAIRLDTEAEVERSHRAVLANGALQRGEIRRRLEFQRARVAGPPQLLHGHA